MTKTIKIVTILLLTISLIILSSFTFATFNPEDYDPSVIKPITNEDKGEIIDITASILKYIRYIGIVLSVIVLSVIGLKYIFMSVEEKASYKENLLLYVVGCILLMASTTIPSLIYQAANG